MAHYIVIIACVVILTLALYLALNPKYDDGIIGNAALGGLAMSAAGPLYETMSGQDYEFLPTTALLYCSLAIFIARHAYRFRRWSKQGQNDWTESRG